MSLYKPLILFTTRDLEVYGYLKTFIEKNLECMNADCMNLYADIEEGCLYFDGHDLPRDDALVAYIQTFVRNLGIVPALTIIGIPDGPRVLYHSGISRAPLAFIPKETDHEPFLKAIDEILKGERRGKSRNGLRDFPHSTGT